MIFRIKRRTLSLWSILAKKSPSKPISAKRRAFRGQFDIIIMFINILINIKKATCSFEWPNGSICQAMVGIAQSPKVSACNWFSDGFVSSLTFHYQPVESKLHVVNYGSIVGGSLFGNKIIIIWETNIGTLCCLSVFFCISYFIFHQSRADHGKIRKPC